MAPRELGPDDQHALERMLGYLNFSEGAEDVQFLAHVNQLYETLEAPPVDDEATAFRLIKSLRCRLAQVEGTTAAFHDTNQVRMVLERLAEDILPGYYAFHRDLLFHHTPQSLFRPFLWGRICEVFLQVRDQWDHREAACRETIRRLNDYVGYRPVAALESRTLEPYEHERVRPIPIYIRGAGVGSGPYRQVVEQALEMLRSTPAQILQMACFDPDHLAELAIDPRAYDFEHPVNKRPNYHFGQWDPHSIDNRGFYDRFVVQQVTLDSLMDRTHGSDGIAIDELVTEAAAVLAGTILMASGVSGSGPETYDSTVTLGNLLPRIASYRDAFYEHLISQLASQAPKHAQRLVNESRRLRQPFGAARQHLNSQLTRRRASQLEHVRLASVYARMGYPEAAQRQIDAVPVASARMMCQIDCNLTRAQRMIDHGELAEAQEKLRESRSVIERGIHCGAFVDPWNIIGFDGNFSLFPAMENSIHDHRVDEFLDLMEETFDAYGRLWSNAAAVANEEIIRTVSFEFEELANWLHQFAIHQVSSVDCADPLDQFRATRNVATALSHWHDAGDATSAIKFWAPYVEEFDSPKAYAMVIRMLLERDDVVAARGLLIHWLGQAEEVNLEQGDDSFHRLAAQWLARVLKLTQLDGDSESPSPSLASATTIQADDWQRVGKFFDYLEANAGRFWQVPHFGTWDGFESAESISDEQAAEEVAGTSLDDDEEEDLYGAAYEDVVYRDSTDDGMESSIYDDSSGPNEALDATHDQIVARLNFLNSVMRLRRIAAIAWILDSSNPAAADTTLHETLENWLVHTRQTRAELEELVMEVWRHRLSKPTHDYLSLAEFDRDRTIKESLMEHIIASCVETAQCAYFIVCALRNDPNEGVRDRVASFESSYLSSDEALAIQLVGSALRGDKDSSRTTWQKLKVILRGEAVLYVPLVRGGNPQSIISVRIRQQMLRTLLCWLPRLGLLTETRELIDVVRQMERNVPAGPGAVTEFDDLFEFGFRALVDSVIQATNVDEAQDLAPSGENGSQLVSCLESMTESMLVTWLAHSRTLRLSVLEKVKASGPWQELVDFIKDYGEDLFTQQFLSLANIRSILYQGVDSWLEQMEEQPPPGYEPKLIQALDKQIERSEAVRHMTLILEAVVENYGEYRDYNSTTTQSDRGDLLYNFLDFLRLLSNYERVVWNLKPVVIAHELLVRRGCNEAAQMWRRALADRISDEADRYQERLSKLQQRYAMQLPTIADRIGERFLRPLIIDRMRSLVAPAIEDPTSNAFEVLESESVLLTRDPSGVGFEAPAWLIALEEEVRRWRRHASSVDEQQLLDSILPSVDLTIEEVHAQIATWESMRDN